MASNIALSASVRQNLLSLQSTAQLMSSTQNRLATGKKVNSALDNPGNFFTSQSLNNRASDLNSLLDSIGQAQQTLKAADTGITSLTKLVESAKSLAKQAQQSAAPVTNYAAVAQTSTIGAETLASHDGVALADPSAGGVAYSFDIAVNGGAAVTVNYTSALNDDEADVLAGLQADLATELGASASLVSLTVGDGGDDLRIAAANADVDFAISNSATSGLTAGTYNSTSLLDNIVTAGGASGDTLQFSINGGTAQTITFGTAAGQISTVAELNTALGTNGSASGTTLTFNAAAATRQTSVELTASTAGLGTALGLGGTTVDNQGAGTLGTPTETRTTYQNQYNDLLTQIDTLAKDATYNGINLLAGDDLKVAFNEDGSSSMTIKGVSFDSASLGLTPLNGTEFQSNSSIDTVLGNIDEALGNLRTQAAKFGSNLTTVQTRQDFTKSMVNNLQVGADALVLADTNEEGANLLALQTRQQLSTTALSLSAQADQAVLRLF
jgi:flagellin-like hook-associated protein FlgL